jgi:transitional endoplasmic reticulum ATPase
MAVTDFQLAVARVRHVDATQRVAYFELQNGNVLPQNMQDDDELHPGDVVLIGPSWSDFEVVSKDLWREERWIGVVRLVQQAETIVNVGGKIRAFPLPDDLTLQKGNTVEGTDSRGVIRIISQEPVPYLELSIADTVNVDHFKSHPLSPLSFEDFGGYGAIVDRARELIEVPLERHLALAKIGARPIKGVLFTGDPGTGKTMLARIIANHADAVLYEISGPEVLSKWFGQSEELVRKIFDDAAQQPRAIVFFDEIDSLAFQRKDESHEASRRIVGQLLTSMDGFTPETNVVVIATTNRPGDIDVALRRPGRFDWEIHFPLPSRPDREAILRTSARALNVGGELPHSLIADNTDGWSPADLTAIWSEAALLAVQDDREEILAEDYFGAYDRVAAQRVLVAASKRSEREEGRA